MKSNIQKLEQKIISLIIKRVKGIYGSENLDFRTGIHLDVNSSGNKRYSLVCFEDRIMRNEYHNLIIKEV